MSENGKKENRKNVVQSVERAIQILQCFKGGEKIGVTEFSKLLGLHKSTVFGLVNTLANYKFLVKDPETGKYRLGIGLLSLCEDVYIGIREVGARHLRQLRESTGETADLTIPDDTDIIYVEKQESLFSMRTCTSIGHRVGMYATAAGKAILAFMDPEETASVIERTNFMPITNETITSKASLRRELAVIREQGWAINNEELEYGLISVGVPVFDATSRRPIAAISVSGPIQRMTVERRNFICVELLRHSAEITRELFR
jgi:IclR family transcriptional regulator, KDG regulon repressor